MLKSVKVRNGEMVSVGDTVALQWDGSSNLPKWLSGNQAKVLEITIRGNLKVKSRADSGTRIIHPESQAVRKITI